jgi:hypothetical protein
MVSEFDTKNPLVNQEELVFIPMVVPGKLAQYLDDLDFLAIQPRDDLGPPMFAEQAEFFGQIDPGCHAARSGVKIFVKSNRGSRNNGDPGCYSINNLGTLRGMAFSLHH